MAGGEKNKREQTDSHLYAHLVRVALEAQRLVPLLRRVARGHRTGNRPSVGLFLCVKGGKEERDGRGGDKVGRRGAWAGGGGGGAYSIVACLRHLAIDRASLSRRSTVPASKRRHFQHLSAHHAVSMCCTSLFRWSYPLPVSPPVATLPSSHDSDRFRAI